METLTEEEVWNLERLVEISMLHMAGPLSVRGLLLVGQTAMMLSDC